MASHTELSDRSGAPPVKEGGEDNPRGGHRAASTAQVQGQGPAPSAKPPGFSTHRQRLSAFSCKGTVRCNGVLQAGWPGRVAAPVCQGGPSRRKGPHWAGLPRHS